MTLPNNKSRLRPKRGPWTLAMTVYLVWWSLSQKRTRGPTACSHRFSPCDCGHQYLFCWISGRLGICHWWGHMVLTPKFTWMDDVTLQWLKQFLSNRDNFIFLNGWLLFLPEAAQLWSESGHTLPLPNGKTYTRENWNRSWQLSIALMWRAHLLSSSDWQRSGWACAPSLIRLWDGWRVGTTW
jgi:hypothetical protein